MKILVLNSGSSSLKYQLFNMPEETVICSGIVEKIGLDNAEIHYKSDGFSVSNEKQIPDHKVALDLVVELLLDSKNGVIKSTDEINAVGHRVVHGGCAFSDTSFITPTVKEKIKDLFSLAPLHNPPNYEGIVVAEKLFKKAHQIAVFDTAFHQSIPEKVYKYAIPNKFLEEDKIRLYGFHGTSHKYVSEKAIEFLNKKNSKIISIHLGGGCSITAIDNGKSVDHSLGFSPASGLVMGTRSGDIDHSLIFHLIDNLGYTSSEVNDILLKQSGMLGLTGYSDSRMVEDCAVNGNKECMLALEIIVYRIKKYIGSYCAALNGLDAIIFTAGIGENSSLLRKMICDKLDFLGIQLDPIKNDIRAKTLTEIQTSESNVKILVIPTNEEIEIAKQSFNLIQEN
ncbi:MAG: acetate kinase [Flavobacteriaceae bacterium]|nr:acetate kinase [Flavobacteriaceae bacterium]